MKHIFFYILVAKQLYTLLSLMSVRHQKKTCSTEWMNYRLLKISQNVKSECNQSSECISVNAPSRMNPSECTKDYAQK